MHWTDRFTSAGPIDAIVGAATDPVSGQPELKATPVRVAPVAAQWRGLLLRGSEQRPAWTLLLGARTAGTGTCVHAHRLGSPAQWPRHGVLDFGAARCAAGAELVIYADPGARHLPLCKRGRTPPRRVRFHCGGKSGAAIAAMRWRRSWVQRSSPRCARSLLAGSPDGPCAARSPAGPSAPALASA